MAATAEIALDLRDRPVGVRGHDHVNAGHFAGAALIVHALAGAIVRAAHAHRRV
jgi:hypothetical protein